MEYDVRYANAMIQTLKGWNVDSKWNVKHNKIW